MHPDAGHRGQRVLYRLSTRRAGEVASRLPWASLVSYGEGATHEGEVVHPGDAEHGGVNAVAFQTAVTKDLPCLHPRQDVLDAGPDLTVRVVVLLFPSRQFGLAAFTAVGEEQAGAPIAAVRDDRSSADGGLRAGNFPCLAIIAVARDRSGDGDTSRELASMTTWWLVEYR